MPKMSVCFVFFLQKIVLIQEVAWCFLLSNTGLAFAKIKKKEEDYAEGKNGWNSQSVLNICFEASSCIYTDTIELASHFWFQKRMNPIIIVSLLRSPIFFLPGGTKILLIFAPDKCTEKRCTWCRHARQALCHFFSFCKFLVSGCCFCWSCAKRILKRS